MDKPQILTLNNAISVMKENRTKVDYYLFDEYEIHLNTVPPGTVQEWHYHSKIEETILVIHGILTISWLEKNREQTKDIHPNELVCVKNSKHTFSNTGTSDVVFVVFRFVPDGINKRDIIKNDKKIVDRQK